MENIQPCETRMNRGLATIDADKMTYIDGRLKSEKIDREQIN